MLNTLQRNWVSRKNTIDVDSNNPNPKLKTTKQARKYSARITDLWNWTPVAIQTKSRGIKEIAKFTKEDITLVKG